MIMLEFEGEPGILVTIKRPIQKVILSYLGAIAITGLCALTFWSTLQTDHAGNARAWFFDRLINLACLAGLAKFPF
jgi:hypothetical protein